MMAVTRRVARVAERRVGAATNAAARDDGRPRCARRCGPCGCVSSLRRGAAGALLAAPPCRSRRDATGATAPYEDLIEVLATLTWHLRDDVYRFPPPKDPTGHDLYKLSLARLRELGEALPGPHARRHHARPRRRRSNACGEFGNARATPTARWRR